MKRDVLQNNNNKKTPPNSQSYRVYEEQTLCPDYALKLKLNRLILDFVADGEQEGVGVTSPISSVPPDVTSPTSSLTSGMVSPLDKPSSAGMATPLSTQTITSPGNVTSPTQKASSSGVISPGYSSGMISPTYRHSADVTSPGAGEKVTSPQRHSAEFTFGTCYGPPRKSPSVTPVTSPTQKSAPGVTSPIQKTPTPTGGVTSPTQRFQQGVLSPTQAAIQVCFIFRCLCTNSTS